MLPAAERPSFSKFSHCVQDNRQYGVGMKRTAEMVNIPRRLMSMVRADCEKSGEMLRARIALILRDHYRYEPKLSDAEYLAMLRKEAREAPE